MNALTPLESLYDLERSAECRDVSLPPVLATLYGRLLFPAYAHRPSVIGNFVTTLDGVVAFNETDHVGGGEISGFNQHDRTIQRSPMHIRSYVAKWEKQNRRSMSS